MKKTRKYKLKMKKHRKTLHRKGGSIIGDYLSEKGARLLGVKPLDKSESLLDRGASLLSENINKILQNPEINKNISQTKELTSHILENINKTMDDPAFKKEYEHSLENISDIASITLKAMDKPIDEVIDKLHEVGEKATSGALSSGIKVGTDIIAAIPGIGAVVELGKIANDASKGVSDVVEAGTEMAETTSDFMKEFNMNLEKGLREKHQLSNRIQNSINEFNATTNHPKEYIKGGYNNMKDGYNMKAGGYKSILSKKNKKGGMKTKRVRFNMG